MYRYASFTISMVQGRAKSLDFSKKTTLDAKRRLIWQISCLRDVPVKHTAGQGERLNYLLEERGL